MRPVTIPAHPYGLSTTFWWLWAGLFISALATFVLPFLALFLSARGFSVAATGLVTSLFGAGMLLAGPVGGWLADHLGRRPTMLAGLTGAAALTAALGFIASPVVLGAALLLFGVALQLARPAMLSTIADVVPAEQRVRAYGLGYWASNVGMSVSLLVGGLLAARGWSLLFLADAATTLAFAFLVWWKVPETRPAGGAALTTPGRRGYGAVLRDRTLLALLGAQFVLLLVFCQHQVAAPLEMARRGLSPAAIGRVLSVNALLVMALQPFAARVTRRRAPGQVLAAAAAVIGVGFGAYAVCATEVQFACATALWTLGEILGFPQLNALVTELAPPDLRGRYQGLAGLASGGAMAIAPALGSACMQLLGGRALWGACLAVGLAVAGFQLVIGRPPRLASPSGSASPGRVALMGGPRPEDR